MKFFVFLQNKPLTINFLKTKRQWNLFKHKILIPISLDPC